MILTKADIEHVTGLARLKPTEFEKEEYARELNAVFDFVEKLKQADTTGVEPIFHVVPLRNAFRPDKIEPSLKPDQALANAPEREGDFFKVPKILED